MPWRALFLAVMLACGQAAAQETPLDVAARVALNDFLGANASGDAERMADVLAPEFQGMRANGVGYGRAEYLSTYFRGVAIEPNWRFENLTATVEGDILVVRYDLVVTETIDGAAALRRAPRLTVFRRENDRWVVVAHSNFAAVD